MAVQANIRQEPAKKGSGGLFGGLGALVGLGAGLLAAPATGGMSLGAAAKAVGGSALAGMAAGSGAGSTIGNLIDPAKAGRETQSASTGESPMVRRLQSGENKMKLQQLKESAMAAATLPPEQRDQYMKPMMQAAQMIKR
jgi:hypothetical protein